MSLFTTQGYRYQLVAGNNVILDTYSDESIKISNNITDLFDIGSVPGTFTRSITLPGTKKNNAFFEQYYDISVYDPDTFYSNAKVNAYLDFGSVYLVNGYMQLMKVNVIENKFVDSYEVNIFGAISNFSVEANRLFLGDLDNLSKFNHSSSYDAITGSWAGELFNGDIRYPMADYGKRIEFSTQEWVGIDDNTDAMTVSDYKPAIRLKALWDGIFEKVGFTYTGSFFNQSWLEDVYILLNTRSRYPEYSYAELETLGQGKVVNILGTADNYQLTNNTQTNLPMGATEYDYNGFFTTGNPFTYFGSMPSRYLANIQLSYRVVNNGTQPTVSQYPAWYLYYYDANGNYINAQVLTIINDYTQNVAEPRIGRGTITENFTVFQQLNMPQMTGSISFKILQQAQVASGSAGGVAVSPNYNLFLNPTGSRDYCTFEVKQVRQAADYRVLEVPLNMPFGTSGIKLIEFVRAIQKKFNLVIYEDKTTPNQMIVESFNDWYLQGQVQDFNQYINIENKVEVIPANTLAVNKVSFNDKLDSDYISKDFEQINNRIYGQSFWIDTGSYFSEGEFKVETSLASGPIFQLPLTVTSGSSVGNSCTSYQVNYGGTAGAASVRYTNCAGLPVTESITPTTTPLFICAQNGTYPKLVGSQVGWSLNGSCTNLPDTQASSSFLPIAIPLYIGDQNYKPTQVFPRMLFNNGMVSSSQYYIEGYFSATNNTVQENALEVYPYFDNYNVISGSYPTLDSRSLLFNNETATLGTTPQNNLIDTYWSTYLNLIYAPNTRLVNASAVIPLAKYFEMELNDLVQFRGNYYHLRAINDYDLTTGECLVQLLGPIISDALATQQFGTAPSGSIPPGPGVCCAPTITSITGSGANINIFFTTSSGCAECTATTVQSSTDGVTFGSNNTGGCDSPRTITAPTGSTYYRMYTNCSSATSSFSNTGSFTPAAPPLSSSIAIDFLIVGGGGGGGQQGGGGGAGAFRSGSLTLITGSYAINVGVGGTGAVYLGGAAQTGSDSSFAFMTSSITAQGGGIGGSAGNAGGNGGSGGGGSYNAGGGIASTGGNDGGVGAGADTFPNGGGGGAGAVGGDAEDGGDSGAGGNGLAWLDSIEYAGGGGGGYTSQGAFFGAGGSGGGGRGAISSASNPQPGTDGKGGGGGGGGNQITDSINGAKGGNGVVKLRYSGTGSIMTGGTITYSAPYTYHTFTNTTGSNTLSFP